MLNKIAKSKWFDAFGVALVVVISISAGYLTENLNDVTHWGHWAVFVPFGLISIANAGLSIMSTRLTGRLMNSGNVIGIINTILSGTTLIFGLSLGANILNAMKLSMQWPFLLVYNFIQLARSLAQGNFANVGKYVYYIITTIASLNLWTTSNNIQTAKAN